jgi:hypothetical protein
MTRKAVADDIPAMVALSDRDRTRREKSDLEFFRKNPAGAQFQALFFKTQLESDRIIAMVDEDAGRLRGFVIASIMQAPPVYDPGGLTILIDDFTIADENEWNSVGLALLEHVKTEGKVRGAVGVVTICARGDDLKHRWLERIGTRVVSEWHFLRI